MFGQEKVDSLAIPSIHISAREKKPRPGSFTEQTENLIVSKLQEEIVNRGWKNG